MKYSGTLLATRHIPVKKILNMLPPFQEIKKRKVPKKVLLGAQDPQRAQWIGQSVCFVEIKRTRKAKK
jgi:hypothetical protein